MGDRFDEALDDFKAQIDNDDTLEPEQAGSQWSDGDVCGQQGCEKSVHERHFPRDPVRDTPAHDSYSEFEYMCVHHGIVATE
jgi:hypothetical protein